jgi:hypothetical protein
MGRMLAGSTERILDNNLIGMLSDGFLRVDNQVPLFALPRRGQDLRSSAYGDARGPLDRSFASISTKPCESVTSSVWNYLVVGPDRL